MLLRLARREACGPLADILGHTRREADDLFSAKCAKVNWHNWTAPAMTSINALAVWDFTVDADTDRQELIEDLNALCKHWVFQKEEGEKTGWIHYQGRISLRKKTRNMRKLWCSVSRFDDVHWTNTSKEIAISKNFDYAMKARSRLEGPWTDQDEPERYVPRQYRVELKEWQSELMAIAEQFNARLVDCLIDEEGACGKTTLAMHATCAGKAEYLSVTNDHKELMRQAFDLPDTSIYFLDMTRAMDKRRLIGFYSAIESIKNGVLWDDRYKFKRRFIDAPSVWVFTNKWPNMGLLSKDRWRFWTVRDDALKRIYPQTQYDAPAQ